MHFPSAAPGPTEQLRALLSSPKCCTIVTHYNPDGDAVGSSLGLWHVLRAAGHSAIVVFPNKPPGFLNWMPGIDQALSFDTKPAEARAAMTECDVLFCLDFNRTDRVAGLEDALKAVPMKVLIDHHQEPEAFANIIFSDTSACATCQMVVDIARALGWDEHIQRDCATCLYTGIVTDSGSFRFGSTTAHTMRTAAYLMERGVIITRIHESILDDNRAERLKLLGFMLNERMEVLPELGTAIIHLSMSDLKRFHYQPGDTEGFVNYGLSIKGIRLAAFFVERPDMVKISLRSKGEVAVDRFVKEHFDGGGHRNAAGGRSLESLSATVDRFRSLLPSFIADQRK
ncbi:MAG: bifunctional oligoribonuclease/PAP phosphatase NrnA [Flavobacteriales bacterium]|nr:bifunctional oligoribonuclease/PAP phosphatase NrnA [Flavobacteriales bacterium]